MGRSCMRSGCHRPATTSFTFDPAARAVWLDPLDDDAPQGSQFLCAVHAERMRAPSEWVITDRRGDPHLRVDEAEPAPTEAAPTEAAPPRRRRPSGLPPVEELTLFSDGRAEEPVELAEAAEVADTTGTTIPELGPTTPPSSGVQPPEAHQTRVDSTHPLLPRAEEDPEILHATTPLLSRAFGASPTPGNSCDRPSR